MADFGSPVAQNVNVDPSKGLSMLSDILGIKSKQLGIQQQQQALQGQAAQVQQEQQTAAQRQGIAGIDWSKYDDGTGVISTDKMLDDKDLQKRAGDQFLDVLKAGAGARTQQLQNKQVLVGLNNQLRDQFGSVVGALRTDPDVVNDTPAGRAKVDAAIARFGAAGGEDAQRVSQIYAPITTRAPPGQLDRGLKAIQLQAMDATQQAEAQQPRYVGAGNRLEQTNPLAAGSNITTGIAPGNQLVSDYAGRQGVFNPQQGAVKPIGGQDFGATTPGEVDTVKQATDRIGQIRHEAQDARTQLDILNRIKALASVTAMGPLMDRFNKAKTLLGQLPGMERVAESAQNFNELTKFLAQNAARQGAALGLTGSDARLEAAQHAMPNTEMDPKTIQRVAEYQSGLVQMAKAKADALDEWLSKPGNSPKNQAEFEKVWRENADPRLFQIKAIENQNDAAAYSSLHIRKDEASSLKAKHDALVSLGALP